MTPRTDAARDPSVTRESARQEEGTADAAGSTKKDRGRAEVQDATKVKKDKDGGGQEGRVRG